MEVKTLRETEANKRLQELQDIWKKEREEQEKFELKMRRAVED